MLRELITRWRQGYRTAAYPAAPPVLPDRFRGRPRVDPARCPEGCRACVEACPTAAVVYGRAGVRLDLGRCTFCGACERVCPAGALSFGPDHRLAATRRADLLQDGREPVLAQALDRQSRRVFGRSLRLRQVSAGGCNACEADVNVLSTVVYDLGRFGIQFTASPRHADGLLITGPVSGNMKDALLKTYAAVPAPKLVISVGACAISGGIYRGHPEVGNGVEGLLPVDLYIPGCPPHPYTTLDGLLRLLGRMPKER